MAFFPTTASNSLEQLEIDISCHTETNSEEFYEFIEELIRQGEFRIWQDCEGVIGFRKEDIVALTPDQETQDIFPSGSFVAVRAMRVFDSSNSEIYLRPKNESFIEEVNEEADNAIPRFYSPTGIDAGTEKIMLAPKPDTNYQAIVEYTSFDSLVDNPTGSWMYNNARDVLFKACLIDSYSFLKADPNYIKELATEYTQRFAELIKRQVGYLTKGAFRYTNSTV